MRVRDLVAIKVSNGYRALEELKDNDEASSSGHWMPSKQ